MPAAPRWPLCGDMPMCYSTCRCVCSRVEDWAEWPDVHGSSICCCLFLCHAATGQIGLPVHHPCVQRTRMASCGSRWSSSRQCCRCAMRDACGACMAVLPAAAPAAFLSCIPPLGSPPWFLTFNMIHSPLAGVQGGAADPPAVRVRDHPAGRDCTAGHLCIFLM